MTRTTSILALALGVASLVACSSGDASPTNDAGEAGTADDTSTSDDTGAPDPDTGVVPTCNAAGEPCPPSPSSCCSGTCSSNVGGVSYCD